MRIIFFKAQSEESGKPAEIIEKMIEGKVSKFLAEVSLTEQDFVKDPNAKISQLLKGNNGKLERENKALCLKVFKTNVFLS